MEVSAPPKHDAACDVREGLSTGTLAALPSALYPELQPLVSLQTTLVLFVLPPLLTR